MPDPLTYPGDCTEPWDRLAYCIRCRELLRLLFNVFGKWLREGITLTKYNKLPQKVKNKYPYVSQLSRPVWEEFLHDDFERRHRKIVNQIMIQKGLLRESLRWPDIKIEDV